MFNKHEEEWKVLDANTIQINRLGIKEIYFFSPNFHEGICISPSYSPPVKIIPNKDNINSSASNPNLSHL